MKILVAGGSSFVGRAIALAALEQGHEVTVVNRGLTPTDLPPSIRRLVGDRHGDLSALTHESFDATIDSVAFQRRDVENLAAALGERAGHYIQISSISAYQDPSEHGADESTPLHELGDIDPNADVTAQTYGPLKAECERAAAEVFSSVGIVRPTYVLGSHDKTFRFPYWVSRLSRGGRVAFPGPRSNALQWIDARDLGAFSVAMATQGFVGAVHTVAQYTTMSFGEVLEAVASQVAPAGTELVEIDPAQLEGMSWYRSFPLWSGPNSEPALNMNNQAALDLGLHVRPLSDTIADTAQWLVGRELPDWWLSADDEAKLLSR